MNTGPVDYSRVTDEAELALEKYCNIKKLIQLITGMTSEINNVIARSRAQGKNLIESKGRVTFNVFVL